MRHLSQWLYEGDGLGLDARNKACVMTLLHGAWGSHAGHGLGPATFRGTLFQSDGTWNRTRACNHDAPQSQAPPSSERLRIVRLRFVAWVAINVPVSPGLSHIPLMIGLRRKLACVDCVNAAIGPAYASRPAPPTRGRSSLPLCRFGLDDLLDRQRDSCPRRRITLEDVHLLFDFTAEPLD